MRLSPAEFGQRIRQCWSLRTATTFSLANPALGQCSVTALVAQDCLGGVIAKTRVGDAWHWYNLINGARCDFTASQFNYPIAYDDTPSDRADALTDTTPAQYAALADALRTLS